MATTYQTGGLDNCRVSQIFYPPDNIIPVSTRAQMCNIVILNNFKIKSISFSSLIVHDGEDLEDHGHVGYPEESDKGYLVPLYQEEADVEGERAEGGGDEAADAQAGDDAGEAVTLHDVNISQDLS